MTRGVTITLLGICLLGPCVTVDSTRTYNVYMQAEGTRVDVLVEKTEDIRPTISTTGANIGGKK